MPRLSKLIEKIEDRLANKWGCWYERNKARVPLYAVLGGIGWYLYGMFLNSLKLGKESVFNTTGEVIESIWVFNPFKNLFAVFTPFGLGVSAFIALMVCLITKKGYSWFSGYKFTRDARGFDILPDGTHGTSGFAAKKELAEHLELGSAEEVKPAQLYKIMLEELSEYKKLKKCSVFDYVPEWKKREEEGAKHRTAGNRTSAAPPAPQPSPASGKRPDMQPQTSPTEEAAASGSSCGNDNMTPEEIGLVEMTCEAILEGDDPELEEMDDPTRIPPGRGI